MSRSFTIEEKGSPNLPPMMLATLNALRATGGSASLHELDEKVVEMEGVTEEEQAFVMPDGKYRRLNYYLAWSRTYLKMAGALENSTRGVWALTDKGEEAVSAVQAKELYDLATALDRERVRQKRLERKATAEPTGDVAEIFRPEDDDDWKLMLLETVREMTPDAFERLSQRLLREAGFTKVEVRGKTGDGGIDGVGVLRVNLVSFQVYFQCKKWKGSVGSKEVRDFRGALQGRADKGLFITTGNFTSQASEEATRDGAIAIDLIDGERLCDLLKQYDLGVKTEMIERVTIAKDWYEAI